MKITSVRSYTLRSPLGKDVFYSSQAPFPERTSCLVRLETDEGLVGWGEGGQWGPPEPVATMVERVLAPRILGKNPLHHGAIWDDLYAYCRDWGRTGTAIEAMSAIDIACWDIAGQALGQPIHVLLGGPRRDRIPTYATGCYYRGEPSQWLDLAAVRAEAERFVASGFGAVKMKVGLLSTRDDLEQVAAVRRAVGPQVTLMVDANHAYAAHTAILVGRSLENEKVYLFEEPVVPEDRAGYREVTRALTLAVAGGECEHTRFGFRDFLAERCVDIAQPDLCCAGGFSEGIKIAALASAFGIQIMPHVWGSGIALAAAIQFLAALPTEPATANPLTLINEPFLEFDRNPNPLRDELLTEPFRVVADGTVAVPLGPGLGVTIDLDALRKLEAASAT